MRTFPLIKDLVTDVSWNYEVNKTITPFTPPADVPRRIGAGSRRTSSGSRSTGSASSASCGQDVCHVLPQSRTEQPFMGPRFLVRAAGLELHPIDQADRRSTSRTAAGIGYCNITKCCTEVCPEHIKITDNAIIPLKERVADEYYDPLEWAWRKLRGEGSESDDRGRAARPPGRARRP
jgi:succinate dehydrogenase / fumarate reductase iron-sulfur subunit